MQLSVKNLLVRPGEKKGNASFEITRVIYKSIVPGKGDMANSLDCLPKLLT